MTHILSPSGRARRHLLLGSAGAALVVALATPPVQARAADVYASGPRTLVSQQANDGAPTSAIATDPVLESSNGKVRASKVTLSGNAIRGAARGNQAISNLAPDALDLNGYGAAYLAAGADGVEADGGAVIASAQTNSGSPVRAETTGSRVAISARKVARSQLSVAGNTQEAVALGNDGSSSLVLTGVDVGAGAGIASLQTTDAGSSVTAKFRGEAALTTTRVSGSDLALTGNLQRAVGYGNSSDNALSVQAVGLQAPSGYGVASVVPTAGEGDPTVEAAYGVLSNQALGGGVRASAGGAIGAAGFHVTVAGGLTTSAVKNDANALVAAGYGNQSANSLDLDAVSITRSGGGEGEGGDQGAVANVTGVQRIDDADVRATARGGAIDNIFGRVADSSISASGNAVRAIATGNLVDGNLLTARAVSIDAPGDRYYGGGEGPVGTALIGYDGAASTTAAFSVQNVQDYGRGLVTAAQADSGVGLIIGGAVISSALQADDNVTMAAATGNSAVNGLSLEATSLRTSADVNSLQTGGGDVLVKLGAQHDRAGASIAALGSVADSSLSVSGNATTGVAIGNTATNSLTAAADTIADGSGHDDAEAGPLPGGFGTAATFALANTQRLGRTGGEGDSAVQIVSDVVGSYAVNGDGSVDRAALTVDGNSQAANALGNTAVNRVALSATSFDDAGALAAGSALSSSQFGDADVRASSDMKVAARGAVTDSAVSLSGNANQALAVVNDADNGLSVHAVRIGAVTGGDAHASADGFGSSSVTGDHVLNSAQYATGSAAASAVTRLVNGDAGGGLSASRFSIEDNVTRADASANRALNSVSVTAASGGEANAGLASSQFSDADVTSSAVTRADYAVGGSPAHPAVNRSSVAVDGNSTTALARGNVADNQLTLVGGSGDAWPPSPEAVVDGRGSAVHASAVLLNGQTNDGAVTARSVNASYAAPLNGSAARVAGSSLGVTGNSVSAGAYGNAASNLITLASLDHLPTAAVANVQTNYGPVTAQVVGATYRILSGPLSVSALSISGNQLAATATGNQATNAIASPR